MSEIQLTETYPVDTAKLWEALVDPGIFGAWCMTERGFELAVGTAFTMESEPNRFWDGIFVCEVKDFEEESRLSYSYRNDGLGLEGMVKWTIEGNTLQLVQTGFTGWKGSFFKILLRTGWKQMLHKNLKKQLAAA